MIAVALATRTKIGAIHALKARLGFDDETYRDFMERETGKRSAKELTDIEAGRLLDTMNKRAAGLKAPSKAAAKGAVRMSGDYAGKLRALWISGYNLGVVHDRSDRALLAFLERQAHISRPEWLSPKDGTKAIEAIKGWLAREAGVDWPPTQSPIAAKRACYEALCRRLIDATGTCNLPVETGKLSGGELDECMRIGGEKLRAALKKAGAK